MHPRKARNEQGAALVMAMMLVVVTGTMLTSMTQGHRLLANDTIDERASSQALQAAEGGIAQARWQLQQDAGYAGERLRIGNAEVDISVTKTDERPSTWRVTSMARTQPRGSKGLSIQSTVSATLAPSQDLPTVCSWRQHGSLR
ncbi:MAG: hypothetical protein AB8H80_09400 [Planctomycetota bacterium]